MNDQPTLLQRAGMSADDLLCYALDVAGQTLRCGGEISRVEETITRICRSYGAQHVEVSAIISMIHATVRMPDGEFSSQLRRIPSGANDLGQLERCNALSRRICTELPDRDTLRREIAALKSRKKAPLWQDLCGAMLAVGGFAIFYGGTLYDGLAAAMVGLLMALLNRYAMPFANHFARTLLMSLLGSVLSFSAVSIGFGDHADKVMIGTIMLVIPGLALGTAVRDLLSEDTISGVLRLFRSLLIAMTIALGYTAGILLCHGKSDFIYQINVFPVMLIVSIIGSTGIALTYRVRIRLLPLIFLGSALSYTVYALLQPHMSGEFFPNLIATIVLSIGARIAAARFKLPAVILFTPSVMPLLPGGLLFYTMQHLISGHAAQALPFAAKTLAVALGIAAGEVTVSLVYAVIRSAKEKLRAKHE